MKFDGKAFGEEIVALTRSFVERSLAPILARLTAAEKALAEIPAPPEPLDVDALVAASVAKAAEEMEARFAERLKEAIAALPVAPTAEEVAALVPKGQDGKDGADGLPGADGAPGRDGVDGKDGRDGIDGKDGADGRDGEKGQDGERGEKGDAGSDGADGVGLADALIDREGNLVVTLTNGATKSIGPVVGRDGAPGADGRDGLGFDDLEIVDDPTAFTLRLARGDHVKEWTLAKPTLADMHKGVWREGGYQRGNVVTWGGSLWIAKTDTSARPETNGDWVLIVKKGRDGKDGEAPKPPPKVKL
jgi:integrin beta 3